ncbi:hypothetical protein ACOMHN_016097 [Nucella lapillus]
MTDSEQSHHQELAGKRTMSLLELAGKRTMSLFELAGKRTMSLFTVSNEADADYRGNCQGFYTILEHDALAAFATMACSPLAKSLPCHLFP